MTELADFGRDVLAFAVLLALPLGGGAVLGALVASVLGQLTGIQDPTLHQVLRVVALAGAVTVILPVAVPEALALVSEALARLPALGRGAP
jgi:flagellar biosynthesis protein FliQ